MYIYICIIIHIHISMISYHIFGLAATAAGPARPREGGRGSTTPSCCGTAGIYTIILCYNILIISYYIILYYTILYYTILYSTLLYSTLLYYIILY